MPATPCALFIDLRRKAQPDAWPEQAFTLAYLVASDLQRTQGLFTTYAAQLAAIPHITVEVTQADTLPFLLQQSAVSRLSLPLDWITAAVVQSGKQLDAILHWDHRRNLSFYQAKIATALTHGIAHFSVYGLQDFTIWQQLQSWLNGQGVFFYERFHAATPDAQSPYQNHIAAFGDISALGGWSRVTGPNGTTRTRGPRQKHWTMLDPMTQNEERLLLGLSHRHGVPVQNLHPAYLQAIEQGLAIQAQDRLQPTDHGLWHTAQWIALLS